MIDAVKDYLVPKRFGVVSYVCLIVHFLCGLILIPVTSALRASEIGKFSCAVDIKSSTVYKIFVEKTCYSRYEQTYNFPLPLYGFVLLSIGLTVIVSVIYSLIVSSRVDEIADRATNGSEGARTGGVGAHNGFYVFYFYLFHLVARSVFGIVFTVLQHTVFYSRGFDFKFTCSLSTTEERAQIAKNLGIAQFNETSITCENSAALEKELWGMIVSVLNVVFALLILGEVIYLCRQFLILNSRSEFGCSCDIEFVTVYLLRKRSVPVDVEQIPFDITSLPLSNSPADCETRENNSADGSLQDGIKFYKQQVLHPSRTTDIRYAPETDLDDVYIDVVIHSGRAQHKFSKKMNRHEIYNVYMEVPQNSIRLEAIKDLFYPNEDTKGKFPRTILAVGRPGIGKTVLTEKIICDWANGIDGFYLGKIVFYFKFRWFNIIEELKHLTLKTFLRYGTGLSEEMFESIFEEISNEPSKAIFIFDGLDEFDGDLNEMLDQSRGLPRDTNKCMSAMNLFIKLAFGNFLQEATVLVTSRPTVEDFFKKLVFERSVEIIGFTSEKIEEYVSRFCENNKRSDLKSKIWNQIKSSSDLLNLCYIPVNANIVCITLSGCLTNSSNDTIALPTTMTSLYQAAIDYLGKCHNTNLDKTSSEKMLEKLQELAFDSMEDGQLVFSEKRFDEQMRKSGLVNSLSNPISPLQTQFCFIHLTIQEFLAAKHVIETLPPEEIAKFISNHIRSDKWLLVLQFIAGLVGEKIKMFGHAYKHCVLDFAKAVIIVDDKINFGHYKNVVMMRCLREVDDEDLVKNACETTALNDVSRISYESLVAPSDWVAVTCICKHLMNLVDVCLKVDDDIPSIEVGKLLNQRCLETLVVECWDYNNSTDGEIQPVVCELMESNCTLNHKHQRLRQLCLRIHMTDAHLSNICTFIKNGHASHLEELDLRDNKITSDGLSDFCTVLHYQLCGQLTYLNFSGNPIGDEGVGMLCSALVQGHCKIKRLILRLCSLTAKCAGSLSEVLSNEDCKLTDLSLSGNDIGDEGVHVLCTDALREEECKLTTLELEHCGLTDQCVALLCDTFQDRYCRVSRLFICSNDFTGEGESLLSDVEKVEIIL